METKRRHQDTKNGKCHPSSGSNSTGTLAFFWKYARAVHRADAAADMHGDGDLGIDGSDGLQRFVRGHHELATDRHQRDVDLHPLHLRDEVAVARMIDALAADSQDEPQIACLLGVEGHVRDCGIC